MPRLVYSLKFETEREPGAEIVEFVVNDRAGTCRGIRPVGKPRVVDLQRFKLAALSAYPQHQIDEGKLASGWRPTEGYLVPR